LPYPGPGSALLLRWQLGSYSNKGFTPGERYALAALGKLPRIRPLCRSDAFLVNQWWLDPATMTAVLEEMSSDHERSLDRILSTLAKVAPALAQAIRDRK
jgi:hypothetical protein